METMNIKRTIGLFFSIRTCPNLAHWHPISNLTVNRAYTINMIRHTRVINIFDANTYNLYRKVS